MRFILSYKYYNICCNYYLYARISMINKILFPDSGAETQRINIQLSLRPV